MPPSQFDAAIELSLDLMRTDAAIRQEVLVLLEALEKDLLGRLAGSELTTWGRDRVEKQLKEINKAIKGYYTQAAVIVLDATKDIAQVAAAATATALSAGVAVVPTETVLSTLATNAMIQGAAQAAWWKKQSEDTAFRFQRAVRQGLVNAEANASIIARVRNELGISRRHAAALVQTSVQTVANEARMKTFQENLDIIKRFRWVTALDSKVCIICAPRDGLEWTKNGMNPIGHKFEWKNPPIHFNDRCLIIPVIFDGPPGGQRASMDGPVDAKETFDGWLSRQNNARQNAVLGPGRAKLYRAGKLSLQDLVSGTGRPLKLAALKRKYGVAPTPKPKPKLKPKPKAKPTTKPKFDSRGNPNIDYSKISTMPKSIEGVPIEQWNRPTSGAIGSATIDKITLNVRSDFMANQWLNMQEYMNASFNSGYFSSSFKNHIVYHELGHVKHRRYFLARDQNLKSYQNIKGYTTANNKVLKSAAAQVSKYGGTNGVEFVAEVYAGVRGGIGYSQEVMKLYELYNGPGFRIKGG